MSEFHPNRQAKVKSRLGLTKARIFESWPFLVWIGVALLGLWGYSRGTVFSRMNGAVDVYQENITPTQDGRLFKIYVTRGQYVEPATLVAEMDTTGYRTQLAGVLQGVAANRNEEIRNLQRQELSLEKEQRDFESTYAADKGKLEPLTKSRERYLKQYGGGKGAVDLSSIAAERLDPLNAEIGEIEGRMPATAINLTRVKESLDKLEAEITAMHQSAELAAKATYESIKGKDGPAVYAGLNDSESRDVKELVSYIDLCYLRTTKGGTIDKLEKDAGEFAKAGESILRVVADPDQLVGFLPQEHTDALSIGSTVWVTPAQDRHQIFETKVIAISPRINSLADATSPLPNRRLYGRDVVLEYPRAAAAPQKGGVYKLVPGQTIIIHTDKPGDIPFMNRVFHNDDINAQ